MYKNKNYTKMKENTKRNNKLKRILTFPMRILGKARDLYVDAMNSYADTACYAGAGFGASAADPLPRSFSATSHRSSDADFKDLIRAASSRAHADKLDLNALNQNTTANPKKALKAVPRSVSVGMAKIDEDKPCEIGDDEIRELKGFGGGFDDKKKSKKGSGLFSRSKSYAVSSTATNRFDR